MRIKRLHLKNFKRFTDLQLLDIPEAARLVLLIGSNGSGKSSVFDAFEMVSDFLLESDFNESESKQTTTTLFKDINYYRKQAGIIDIAINTYDDGEIIYGGGVVKSTRFLRKKMFYGRTAFRYLPRITKTTIGSSIDVEKDADKPKFYIDADQRFENDIDLLIKEVIEKVFQGINTNSPDQLSSVRSFLSKFNDAFPRVFGTDNGTKLIFKSFVPPAEGRPSRLVFQKGQSELDYDLLSAGEKEVVNLLFNLFVRSQYYTNTIYFLDEIDTHLNTKLQYNLLKEITENWIPPGCQLWTASHSLGFIDYANDSSQAAIFDLDDLDFDLPQTLRPSPKNDNEVFEIAVGRAFIEKIVQGRRIIFSENNDTFYYNELGFDNTFFFNAIDKGDVFHKAKNHQQQGLVDRDYLTDEEVQDLRLEYPWLYVLPFYSFENLLYHPANLEEYYSTNNLPFDKEAYLQKLVQAKNEAKENMLLGMLGARNGYPFYKENENAEKLKTFRATRQGLIDLLRSDDLSKFYKIFPMKDYATRLPERQNLPKGQLAATAWFKAQLRKAIG